MTTANDSKFSFSNNEFGLSMMLVAGVLVAVALIYLFVFSMASDGFGKNMQWVEQAEAASVVDRIRPVVSLDAMLNGESAADAPQVAVASARSPADLYNGACMACHAAGVAGAPLFGDKAAWEPRLAQGNDLLLTSVVQGKGAMPPKGGSTYSDEEIRSVIDYMLVEAGL
jgi:cytochrome c5